MLQGSAGEGPSPGVSAAVNCRTRHSVGWLWLDRGSSPAQICYCHTPDTLSAAVVVLMSPWKPSCYQGRWKQGPALSWKPHNVSLGGGLCPSTHRLLFLLCTLPRTLSAQEGTEAQRVRCGLMSLPGGGTPVQARDYTGSTARLHTAEPGDTAARPSERRGLDMHECFCSLVASPARRGFWVF